MRHKNPNKMKTFVRDEKQNVTFHILELNRQNFQRSVDKELRM